jgi:hypothetical protein
MWFFYSGFLHAVTALKTSRSLKRGPTAETPSTMLLSSASPIKQISERNRPFRSRMIPILIYMLAFNTAEAVQCRSDDPSLRAGAEYRDEMIDTPDAPVISSAHHDRLAIKNVSLEGPQKNVLRIEIVRAKIIEEFRTPTIRKTLVRHFKAKPVRAGIDLPFSIVLAPINKLAGNPTFIKENVDMLKGCDVNLGSAIEEISDQTKPTGKVMWASPTGNEPDLVFWVKGLGSPIEITAALADKAAFNTFAQLELPLDRLAKLDVSKATAITIEPIERPVVRGLNAGDKPFEISPADADLLVGEASAIPVMLDFSDSKKLAVKKLQEVGELLKREWAAEQAHKAEIDRQREKEQKDREAAAEAERLKPITSAKQSCSELGFRPNTEKHAKCVLDLLK